MTEIINLIKNHRSIRKYQDKPIEDGILKELLTIAQWAPSSHNVQAYSIIVVKDSAKKKEISKLCGEQKWIEECPVFLVFCADLYRLKLACEMKNTKYELDEIENLIVGVVDTSLAAENVFVGAKSFGLGGVMIGGIRNDLDEITRLLKLPEYVIPIMGMCLGYPAEEPGQKPRLPQYGVVFEDEYNIDVIEKALLEYEEVSSDYYKKRTNNQKSKGWTTLMSEYISTQRRAYLKDYIIRRGIKLK